MRNTFLIILLVLNFRQTYSQYFQWAKVYNSSGNSMVLDVDVDSDGNVYTTGGYSGHVDFDPATESYHYLYCDSSQGDIFLSKLDADGGFEWVIGFGSGHSFGEYGTSVKVDSNGDVIVTGIFYDTVDFDPSDDVYNMTSTGSKDTFICKYDSDGNFIWGRQQEGNSSISPAELFVKDDNIYLVGSFKGSVNFDPIDTNFTLSSHGESDIFFCKYNSSGSFEWVKGIGGNQNDSGFSIFVDANNDVYITGGFWGSVDFDPSVNLYYLYSAGYNDICFAKYDNLGNFIYAKGLEGNSYAEFGTSIRVDDNANIYLTGTFTETVDFDPSAGNYYLSSHGGVDVFLAKYNSQASLEWAYHFGGSNNDSVTSLAIDNQTNSVYTIGSFQETGVFGTEGVSSYLSSNGESDVFIQKIDMDGNFHWVGSIGGSFIDSAYSIVYKNDKIYFGGSFYHTVDFDITSSDYEYTNLYSYKNAFFCKYNGTTLINNDFEKPSVIVYPNPFKDAIQIEIDSPSLVTVYSILGEELYKVKSKDSLIIDTSDYERGCYFVRIENNLKIIDFKMLKK